MHYITYIHIVSTYFLLLIKTLKCNLFSFGVLCCLAFHTHNFYNLFCFTWLSRCRDLFSLLFLSYVFLSGPGFYTFLSFLYCSNYNITANTETLSLLNAFQILLQNSIYYSKVLSKHNSSCSTFPTDFSPYLYSASFMIHFSLS